MTERQYEEFRAWLRMRPCRRCKEALQCEGDCKDHYQHFWAHRNQDPVVKAALDRCEDIQRLKEGVSE